MLVARFSDGDIGGAGNNSSRHYGGTGGGVP